MRFLAEFSVFWRFSAIFDRFALSWPPGRESEWESWESAENRAGTVGIPFSLDFAGRNLYNNIMKIVSYTEAKKRGLKRYFPGTPCKYGHISERYATGSCVTCNHVRNADPIRKARRSSTRKEEKRLREAGWSDDRKALEKQKKQLRDRERRAAWSDDRKALEKQKGVERHRKRRAAWTEEDWEKQREREKKSWQKVDPITGKTKYQAWLERPGNREKCRQKTARWYANNPEKAKAACAKSTKKRRLADPEGAKARDKANREKRKVQISEYNRARYLADPEAGRARNKEAYRKAMQKDPERVRGYKRKHNRTPLGVLRKQLTRITRALCMGSLEHSRFVHLDYNAAQWSSHLEQNLPDGFSVSAAMEAGYHIDHIVPVSFVSAALSDNEEGRLLAFKVITDLKNLRMIPAFDNISKGAKLDLNPMQAEIFDYLCEKYDVWDEMVAQAIPY